MTKIKPQRTTKGVVDRIEPNGVVFVHEINTRKSGYLANTTPVVGSAAGSVRLKPGTELSLDVVDQGDVMIVSAARLIGG